MTELEYIKKLEGAAQMTAPHEITISAEDGKSHLRILDLSQIPGADRKFFDDQGMWVGDSETDAGSVEAQDELRNQEEGRKESSSVEKDGPTIEQYVAAGYKPENYPPAGYAVVDSLGWQRELKRRDEASKASVGTTESSELRDRELVSNFPNPPEVKK